MEDPNDKVGDLTPRRGLAVVWKDVNYTVGKDVKILQDITAFARPGDMTALMGPSGSGKTTLLDILAGRKTTGTIEGEVLIGGAAPTPAFLRRYCGYVEQFDTLLDVLTVSEMLEYQAQLKRPSSEPFSTKKAIVDQVIDRLGLDKARNVLIGNPLQRGISGGQAKRVNIGIALVTDPKVLFLDEPTSGLDSLTADEVMATVRHVATAGVTVVSTIHSPSSYSFGLFDRLLLLFEGRIAYFGPTGESLFHYFDMTGIPLPPRRSGENDSEWIIRVTTGHARRAEDKTSMLYLPGLLTSFTHRQSRQATGRGSSIGGRPSRDAGHTTVDGRRRSSVTTSHQKSKLSRSQAGSASAKVVGGAATALASLVSQTASKTPVALPPAGAPGDADGAGKASDSDEPSPSHAVDPNALAKEGVPAGEADGDGEAIPVSFETGRMAFVDAYETSALRAREVDEASRLAQGDESAKRLVEEDPRKGKATTVGTAWAFWVLFRYRSLKNYWGPMAAAFYGPRIGQRLIVSFILFTLFFNLGNNYYSEGTPRPPSGTDQSIAVSIASMLFVIVVFLGYGAAAYVPTLIQERALFLRERSDGVYYTGTYLIHKLFEEALPLIPTSFALSALMWYPIRLGGSFILFVLNYFVGSMMGILVAYFAAAISPTMEVGNALLPAIISTFLFFAGFFLPFDKIRWYWRWYAYIDYMKYSFASLVLNQFSGERNPRMFGDNKSQTLTEFYGLDGSLGGAWGQFGLLCIFPFVTFFLAWSAMVFVNFSRR